MAYTLDGLIVIGISSTALFDLSEEIKVYNKRGMKAYIDYQIKHENDVLKPGTGFRLIKALLKINDLLEEDRRIEVILMTKNPSEVCLRLFNSIDYYHLDINRAVFTNGHAIEPYFKALKMDLFLSKHQQDVQHALNHDIASAFVYDFQNEDFEDMNEIRIAFDGDAVIFSDESEKIYQDGGLEAFSRHEYENRYNPLKEGPFTQFIKTIGELQIECQKLKYPIYTALVTSRSHPSIERVARTLRLWNIKIDEVFYLGGLEKTEILKAFHPQIFFDDQEVHVRRACLEVPSAQVFNKKKEKN